MFLLRSIFHVNVKIRKIMLHMVGNFLNKNGENGNNVLRMFFCGGAYLFMSDLGAPGRLTSPIGKLFGPKHIIRHPLTLNWNNILVVYGSYVQYREIT